MEAEPSRYDCSACGRHKSTGSMLKCSRCRSAYYCDVRCQRAAWKTHKEVCRLKGDSSESPPMAFPVVVFDAPCPKDRGLLNQVLNFVGAQTPGAARSASGLIKALLKRGANPSSVCRELFDLEPAAKIGLSAIHVACAGGAADKQVVVSLLRVLSNESQVAVDWHRWAELPVDPPVQGTPLAAALYRGHQDVVCEVFRLVGAQVMAAADADAEICETIGAACQSLGVRELMNKPCWLQAESVACPTTDLRLPLHIAAVSCNIEAMAMVLAEGADVNALTIGANLSALELSLGISSLSIRGCAVHAALALLKAGASPRPSKLRVDSLERCIDVAGGQLGNAQLFSALLDAGADPILLPYQWRYTNGTIGSVNYCSLAAERGFTDIVELALQAGASLETRTYDFCETTLLGLAAGGGHLALVRMLLERGADVNATFRGTAIFCPCCAKRGVDNYEPGPWLTATEVALHPDGGSKLNMRIVRVLRNAGGLTFDELPSSTKSSL